EQERNRLKEILRLWLPWIKKRYQVTAEVEEKLLEISASTMDRHLKPLKIKLKQGDKSLVGNKGYRKYLQTQGERFVVDKEKIKTEARFDGKWVLRTNTSLPTAEVAVKYKQLWMVEDIFRSAKSLLETRPIFHKTDETIRGQ
ncbi:MAG: hypothetical protein GY703_23350, partial [Gammaproteobacteria bacterium]|nr:hypothetical protein [Gammaproteobacteria bacterium]